MKEDRFFILKMNDTDEVLNVVYSVMGSNSRKHYRDKCQIAYDCPVCDNGKGSGNLEINYNNLVMRCWKCGESPEGLKGSLYSLIKEYGTHRELRAFREATRDFVFEGKKRYEGEYVPDIKLPWGYKLIDPKSYNLSEKEAYNYIKNRGISDEQIKKYEIGFCDKGDYSGRIVIPSFDVKGNLNFFVSRSYVGHKQKYMNPEVMKNEIIVNEQNINWDSTIYLVEGMFDMIGLGFDNTIPLLGKSLSDKLYETIMDKAKGYVVICLDPDAKTDAYRLYNKLDTCFSLNDKIRVMDLPLNLDIAKIKEIYGDKGVLKCVRQMRKLTLEDKINYNLI